jgi:hypothetical protein
MLHVPEGIRVRVGHDQVRLDAEREECGHLRGTDGGGVGKQGAGQGRGVESVFNQPFTPAHRKCRLIRASRLIWGERCEKERAGRCARRVTASYSVPGLAP